MEQASQTRSAAGVFPDAAFGADAQEGWTPGATSTLLFVGSRPGAPDLGGPPARRGRELRSGVGRHAAPRLALDQYLRERGNKP